MIEPPDEQPASDKAVKRFVLKVASLLTLKYALIILTFWSFIWGTAVVSFRFAAGASRLTLLWGLAALVPGLIVAIILGIRKAPPISAARALLDYRSGCGGILMAAEDQDVGRWRDRLKRISAPSVRWRGGRTSALFGLSVLFAVAGFLVPVRQKAVTADNGFDIGNELEKLSEQVQVLKEEEIIEPATAESLEEKLKQIGEEAKGEDPAKTWEALDHLENTISKTANNAAEEALGTTEQLSRTETLAQALGEDSSQLNSQLATEAMKELSQMAKESAAESEMFDDALSGDLREALEGGKLNSDQLKRIASKLQMSKAEIARELKALREAGLIDGSKLKECEKLGKCDSGGLAAFLKENAKDASVSESVAAFCRSRPGKGGIDRGRGDAAMAWSEGSSEQGAKFKEQVLPPGAVASLENSKLVGRSTGAPTVETGSPQSGALNGAASGGGSAFTQTVFPRHRGAVQRYFERQ